MSCSPLLPPAVADLESALWRVSRVERFWLLNDWVMATTDWTVLRSGLRHVLPAVWRNTELPHQEATLWLSWFRWAGYVSDTTERLTGSLTIYRGTGVRSTRRAMSWSLRREVAEWFARRPFPAPHRRFVLTTTIDASQVLAYLTGQNEAEVVVDGSALRHVHCERLT